MKLVLTVTLFATAAVTQIKPDVPSCAQPCMEIFFKNATTCALDDWKCLCWH
jgi:hypothetical protein